MSKRLKKTSNKIDDAKNQVRGAIATLKASSVPGAPRLEWAKEQSALNQLNKALAIAKRNSTDARYAAFEHWAISLANENTKALGRLGRSVTSLGLLPPKVTAKDLATELHLAIEHISRGKESLGIFMAAMRQLGDALWERRWTDGEELLKKIVAHHGYSYWAIENELGITQHVSGMEAVKERAAKLSICAINLNKFFLYYLGVRNEPAQATNRFKANIRKKIDEAEISEEWKLYSKFRLYGYLDITEKSLSIVLACEQSTTLIDLFISTAKICQAVLSNENKFSAAVVSVAHDCYECLSDFSENYYRPTDLKDEQGSKTKLQEIADEALHVALETKPEPDTKDFCSTAVLGLASKLSVQDQGLATELLAKELLNFPWLPLALEIGDLEQVPQLPELATTGLGAEKFGHNSALQVALYNALQSYTGGETDGMSASAQCLTAIIREQKSLEDRVSAERLRQLLASNPSKPVADTARVVLAKALFSASEFDACIEICAEAGIENERLSSLLPLLDLFQGARWATIKEFAHSINLAIALDHLLRVVDEQKTRTLKRFAVENLMKTRGAENIGSLLEALRRENTSPRKLEYFFNNVCDIPTLELLPKMNGSRCVWTIRSAILKQLAELHTENEARHLNEAEDIDDDLQVNDGLLILDDSKVYIDEKAALQGLNNELAADFQRYLQLVQSGVGVSESINEILRNIKKPSAKAFQVPKNDADDLLADLVSTILKKFLFDELAGLDVFLGRRIRHGSIESELRGALGKLNLIGNKSRIGKEYSLPARVENIAFALDVKQKKMLTSAFSRFSESIDNLVANLRDEVFYVESSQKKDGIFSINLNALVFSLIRSLAQTSSSIEQFSKECLQIFWVVLSDHLNSVRPHLEAEIKRTLTSIFAKLNNELNSLGIRDPALIALVQQASEELQRRAAVISGWVRVPKINIEGRTFSLQRAVDVASAVVTGQNPGFAPIISSSVPDNYELERHGFAIVTDALYIAFTNIAQHSGKKHLNRVSVDIEHFPDTSLLSFKISNELGTNSRIRHAEGRLAGIRQEIQKKAFVERSKRSKGSGLSKLAALVLQSDKTKIAFGFVDEKRFELEFDLVYVPISHAALDDVIDEPVQNDIQAMAS